MAICSFLPWCGCAHEQLQFSQFSYNPHWRRKPHFLPWPWYSNAEGGKKKKKSSCYCWYLKWVPTAEDSQLFACKSSDWARHATSVSFRDKTSAKRIFSCTPHAFCAVEFLKRLLESKQGNKKAHLHNRRNDSSVENLANNTNGNCNNFSYIEIWLVHSVLGSLVLVCIYMHIP